MSKGVRLITILLLALLAVLFAIGGKFLLTLPLTLASLALLKLKGLSIFQLISLFRLIQTLRRSGRFSFNQTGTNNVSSISNTVKTLPAASSNTSVKLFISLLTYTTVLLNVYHHDGHSNNESQP